MNRIICALCAALVLPAFATISNDLQIQVVTDATAATTVTQNLAIKVTSPQTPTAVSFSPAGPVTVVDNSPQGTVISAVQVTTSDGAAFAGTLAITAQTTAGVFALSGSNVVVGNINSADDGMESVTVQACESNTCVSGTLGTNVVPPVMSSGLLPADRDASANWKMAGMQSVGGIPNRTVICATVAPRGGGADDTANIQTAINGCPVGQAVQLVAGTFVVAEGSYILLNKSVTLRGAGPGQTIVRHPPGTTCPPSAGQGASMNCSSGGASPANIILMSNVARFVGDNATACALTSDIAAGTVAANVNSACAGSFHVGDVVLLDELSGKQNMPDPENPGTPILASSDYRVTYHRHSPPISGDDGTDVECQYTVNCDRVTNEIKQIASVSGNTVTFDSPATISYRVSHTADLWHFATPFLQKAGVESLTLEYGDDGNLQMQYCAYCWLYKVESRFYIGPSIQLNTSFRPQMEQFYIHEAAWPVPGGAGYNFDLRYDTSEALIENGISVLADKVMTARGSGAGSVIAYNYVDKGYIRDNCCWQEIGLNASHLVGPHHILFEGNWAFNMDSDATHGGSIYMTYFRNHATAIRNRFNGLDDGALFDDSAHNCGTSAYSGSPLRAAAMQAYSYWFSFIGNVLGTKNCTTQANGFPLNGSWNGPDFSNGIFLLGWYNGGNGINDPQGATIYPAVPAGVNGTNSSCTSSGTNCATIVDGNYNYWNNSISWASNDTAHTLPNSLYLSGMPSFFNDGSGYAWPWVTPTGASQVATGCGGACSGLPAKARYDAGTPFTQP